MQVFRHAWMRCVACTTLVSQHICINAAAHARKARLLLKKCSARSPTCFPHTITRRKGSVRVHASRHGNARGDAYHSTGQYESEPSVCLPLQGFSKTAPEQGREWRKCTSQHHANLRWRTWWQQSRCTRWQLLRGISSHPAAFLTETGTLLKKTMARSWLATINY